MLCRALVLAVFALCLHQGEAIKCHVCNSASDPKCGDPVDSSVGLTECTPNILKDASSFLKGAADTLSGVLGKVGIDTNIPVPDANAAFACVKAVRQDGEKKFVVRSCSIPKNENFDVCMQAKAKSTEGVVTFCDTCETDGCNGARGLSASAPLAALLAALALAALAFQ